MSAHSKISFVFLLVAFAAVPSLLSRDRSIPLESFRFGGRIYSLNAVFHAAGADLALSQGRRTIGLNTGMEGENILLGTRTGSDNFYVFWLNYRQKAIRLAFYDHRLNRSRLLPLTDFSFIALPEIIEENSSLQGLVFLGNRSSNDDLFYFEPEKDLLTALTETPFSEKGFKLLEIDDRLVIETCSLWAQYRYLFDPRLRKSVLLEEKHFPARQKKSAAAVTPEYYNTYIGFGDSITWGEIEGVQRLDLCYLTQMRDTYLPAIYGPSQFINLGVPGDDTSAGAQRIDQDLNDHPGFYFLLMLGVNDAIRRELSVDSALENLSYIMDAAQARGMRIIASTLTPSKAHFSLYSYYWENLQELSAGILDLAGEKNVPSIDPLTAFMNTNPPDGWRDLLENIIPNISSGNHPNAAGHSLIASLFTPALAAFPPLGPQNITILNPQDKLKRNVHWDPCYESDFSYYHIEFGFKPLTFDYSLNHAASHYTFNLFPFLPQLYFRIQTVDHGGNASVYSSQKSPIAATPRLKKEK